MFELNQFENLGYAVAPNFLDDAVVNFLNQKLDAFKISSKEVKHRDGAAFGVRNLLQIVPEIKDLTRNSQVKELVQDVLGDKARIVRAIFFDKTAEANWKVPFHQDLTIAVRKKIEVQGFLNWTQKADIFHVQPPVKILEKMLTLRIHLDDADKDNGALKVVPASHIYGRLTAEEIQELKARYNVFTCEAKRGDGVLMKPLLLHASSASTNPSRRRVIHLEFSAENLPNGLEWHESQTLS